MTATALSDEAVEAFLAEAARGRGREGVRLALDLLDRGVPGDAVIVDLLAVAQRKVGERWHRNDYSVADEHLATGVAQKALDALADAIEPPAPTGLVVVACAEGDWHSLPAQMFAELLRSHGFAVAFLGGSTPVDHAEALLARDRPDALAISCSVPLFYGGVRRLADAAHRHGIPVIAGGRALGSDPRRAIRLGADAWSAGIDDAAAILRAWHRDRPTVSAVPTPPKPEVDELERKADAIAAEALDTLMASSAHVASYDDRQRARTLEDLAYIVRFVAAARAVDDPTVLTDFLDWLRSLLAARDVPPSAVDAGLAALVPVIARTDPAAGRLVAGERGARVSAAGRDGE